MAQTTELETPEQTAQAYLDRFSQANQPELRTEIETLASRFKVALVDQQIKGTLHVVGGTINKRLPRKDIDVIATLEPRPTDPVRQVGEDEMSYLARYFDFFRDQVQRITLGSPFRIVGETPPFEDHEFEGSGIPAHDGSISVSGGTGTVIEFISNPGREFVPRSGEPTPVLLAKVA